MSNPNLEIQDFQIEVLEAEKPVLVDFWAAWCGPCRMMSPILDKFAGDDEYKDKIEIRKMDVEVPQNQMIASALGVQGIPNMKVFYRGKVIKNIVGARPEPMFKQELDEVLKSINND